MCMFFHFCRVQQQQSPSADSTMSERSLVPFALVNLLSSINKVDVNNIFYIFIFCVDFLAFLSFLKFGFAKSYVFVFVLVLESVIYINASNKLG